jgi:hypothetical protein
MSNPGIAFGHIQSFWKQAVAKRYSLPTTLAALGLSLSLLACDDDPIRPDGFFDSAEAEAVLHSAAALPSLPELIAAASEGATPGRVAELLMIQEGWIMGTAAGGPEGLQRRRDAAAHAAPLLARDIPAANWEDVRLRTEQWIATATLMLRHLRMPDLHDRLTTASWHLDQAGGAAQNEARVYHAVVAMAELVETTPRSVARTMVRQATTAVAAAEARAGSPAELRDLERARRLSDWAARAAHEQDYLRAIQRAYYALQLVEEVHQ